LGHPAVLALGTEGLNQPGHFVTLTGMAVDGSSSSIVFGLRNTTDAIGTTADITRLIFTCLTNTAVDLSKFGDLAPLTKGLVLRRVDGTFRNIFNVKTNQEVAGLMFDFNIQTALGNAQDGFVSRLTFAGQNKIGVTLRLAPGEDLNLIVQDDLATSQTGSQIISLEIVAEGHEVE